MPDWVWNLAEWMTGPIRALADWVRSRLRAIWDRLMRVFRLVRTAWGVLGWAILWFLRNLDDWAVEVFRGFLRVIKVWFPRWRRWILERAARLISVAIRTVRDFLRGLISDLSRWARRAIDWLRDRIASVFRWASQRIGELLSWVRRIGNRVADLVLHPGKLAAWLLPALWSPLWRFIAAKAEPIGRWIMRRAVAATLGAAALIETVLVKLFI